MIEFDAKNHRYFNNGKELISVTQLMRKHGLAPDYSAVRSDVLQAKAERGTLIHKEIEDYIKNGVLGFTTECAAFVDYIEKNEIGVGASEYKVYNDICAGTVDLFLLTEVNTFTIADIKTTATLHKDAVSWQLSIYNALDGWRADNAQAFHFNADGELNVVDIPLKPKAEVERLFECERAGVLYTQELTTIDDGQLAALAELERYIAAAEATKKAAEQQRDELKAKIMAAMEQNGIKTFETNKIRLTYVAPSTRATIDTARLKKELPEIAEQYAKTSETKASLKITIKEDLE